MLPGLLPFVMATHAKHSFELGKDDFLLDGKPFVIRSGEMHPERIPRPYWRHRIQMAKALGLNTVALYTFWNAHEKSEGKYDFRSGNLNTAEFIRTCQQEGMFVLLRPGPYCCGEWDFGGIPPYLLRHPDLKIRCMDPWYIKAVDKYITRLAKEVVPLQVSHGGPVLMVQVENEYGSYSNDKQYTQWLHDKWRSLGVDVPMYTSDGPTPYMLEAGSVPGCAIGLDSLSSDDDVKLARKIQPGVPVMSGETYPGWLTHWGEPWASSPTDGVVKELKWLLDTNKSFNLYVLHGGTNFGLTAGANSGGKGYEPDVTSYDYDAPVDEQGRATPKYWAMRDEMARHLGAALPPVPAPVPSAGFAPVTMEAYSCVEDQLGKPVKSAHPMTFESMGQNLGLALYSTTLVGRKSGKLRIGGLHDFATVYLDGTFVGTLDRRLGQDTIELPPSRTKHPRLEILVEGMGHINYGGAMIDRKGITGQVFLEGMCLASWQTRLLDLAGKPPKASPGRTKGTYFRGEFEAVAAADTFIDLSRYVKGYAWVNGHLLGRFWEIGPQKRLYCPAEWMVKGKNTVVVLDLLSSKPQPVSGEPTLKG